MVQNEKTKMDEEINEDLESFINHTMNLNQILCKQHLFINEKTKWKLGNIFNF